MGGHVVRKRFVLPVLIGVGTPALACDFCSAEVTLTPDLAACYLDRVETEIDQMRAANLPAQLINLSSCEGAETGTRGTAALPSINAVEKKPDLSFLMDADGMRCLAMVLQDETWSPERVKTFEVQRDCEAQ